MTTSRALLSGDDGNGFLSGMTHTDGPPQLSSRPLSSSEDAVQTRIWIPWALSCSIWTLLACLSIAGSGLYYVVAGGGPPAWKFIVGVNFTDAYVWALLTPLIYRLARRYSFDPRSWTSAALFHVASALVVGVGAAFATCGINWLTRLIREGVPLTVRAEMVSLFLQNVPRYCLIVAVAQAVLYYERLQARRLQSSRLEAQLVQAQLQTLKMQLQPHFLFNVLNSIATLSRRDPAATEKMTLQLAELLRMSLQSEDLHQVPLRRELEFLDCYLRIQQTRFQDRLRVHFEVDPVILDAAVPPLLLQPLVENAVRHGISPRPEPGHITVRAQKLDRWIDLEIMDNGVGLPVPGNGTPKEGVGLRNTRARLHQLYGQNFEFRCENATEGGCRVSVRLPFSPAPIQLRKDRDDPHANR